MPARNAAAKRLCEKFAIILQPAGWGVQSSLMKWAGLRCTVSQRMGRSQGTSLFRSCLAKAIGNL